MRLRTMATLGALLVSLLGATRAQAQPPGPPAGHLLQPVATIGLPGPPGFADYLTLRSAASELYVGFTSASALVVIDTRTNKVRNMIPHLSRVHQIALSPHGPLGYTSNGGDNTVGVIDLVHQRLLRRIPGGLGPDALLFDARANLIYVANHRAHAATLIDAASERIVGTVPLGGTAEYAQADPTDGRVFQNVESANQTVVVDPQRRAVVARYKTAPGEGPTALYFDAPHRRLFVGCGNGHLIVLNADTGAQVADVPIGQGCDAVGYDMQLGRIYTANGESANMTIIRQEGADGYHVLDTVPTLPYGHALAVDPLSHRVYVVGRRIAVFQPVR